jgi:hypothetical protein
VAEEEWLEKGKEREIPGKRKERVAEGGSAVCGKRCNSCWGVNSDGCIFILRLREEGHCWSYAVL